MGKERKDLEKWNEANAKKSKTMRSQLKPLCYGFLQRPSPPPSPAAFLLPYSRTWETESGCCRWPYTGTWPERDTWNSWQAETSDRSLTAARGADRSPWRRRSARLGESPMARKLSRPPEAWRRGFCAADFRSIIYKCLPPWCLKDWTPPTPTAAHTPLRSACLSLPRSFCLIDRKVWTPRAAGITESRKQPKNTTGIMATV